MSSSAPPTVRVRLKSAADRLKTYSGSVKGYIVPFAKVICRRKLSRNAAHLDLPRIIGQLHVNHTWSKQSKKLALVLLGELVDLYSRRKAYPFVNSNVRKIVVFKVFLLLVRP